MATLENSCTSAHLIKIIRISLENFYSDFDLISQNGGQSFGKNIFLISLNLPPVTYIMTYKRGDTLGVQASLRTSREECRPPMDRDPRRKLIGQPNLSPTKIPSYYGNSWGLPKLKPDLIVDRLINFLNIRKNNHLCS